MQTNHSIFGWIFCLNIVTDIVSVAFFISERRKRMAQVQIRNGILKGSIRKSTKNGGEQYSFVVQDGGCTYRVVCFEDGGLNPAFKAIRDKKFKPGTYIDVTCTQELKEYHYISDDVWSEMTKTNCPDGYDPKINPAVGKIPMLKCTYIDFAIPYEVYEKAKGKKIKDVKPLSNLKEFEEGKE